MNKNAKATIRYHADDLFVGITPGGVAQIIDADAARSRGATPIELLMLAVGGCTAIDVVSILEKKRQNVTDYAVEVTGERRDEHPRSFVKFNIHHVVRGRNVSPEAVAHAIKLSNETYCSVHATVKPAAEIVTSFEVVEEDSI